MYYIGDMMNLLTSSVLPSESKLLIVIIRLLCSIGCILVKESSSKHFERVGQADESVRRYFFSLFPRLRKCDNLGNLPLAQKYPVLIILLRMRVIAFILTSGNS
jgi:hypothetical protein